ncbi:MAG: HAD family hydrolase [Candidatus Methanofastidiosia archaeon]
MRYDTFIFDLDGTLVHTESQHRYKIVGQTLKELNVTNYSNEDINKFWFGGNRNKTIKECFGLEPKNFWNVYRKHDTIKEREKYTKPYSDVEFIKEIKSKGYKIGIVTGAPIDIANLEIGILGNNFDAVVIAQISNGISPKPNPHGIMECLNILNSSASKTIYIGNSDEDIIAGKEAGVLDVLIKRGEYEFDLKELNPSLIIKSLYELRKFC